MSRISKLGLGLGILVIIFYVTPAASQMNVSDWMLYVVGIVGTCIFAFSK